MPRRIEVFDSEGTFFSHWIPRLIHSCASFLQELNFSWEESYFDPFEKRFCISLHENEQDQQERLFQEVVGSIRECTNIRKFGVTEVPDYLIAGLKGIFESLKDKTMLSDLCILTKFDIDRGYKTFDVENMRSLLMTLNSIDRSTRRFKLSISDKNLKHLAMFAKTDGTPIALVTELGKSITIKESDEMSSPLLTLDSSKEEFSIFFSLFPGLNLCRFAISALHWKPTLQMRRTPFAMVFGFLETFESADTKRVMELKINLRSINKRRESEIRNLMHDVKDLGGQMEVVEEAEEYTLKLEVGSALKGNSDRSSDSPAKRIMFATGDPDKFPHGISPEILEEIFSYINCKEDNAQLELVNKVRAVLRRLNVTPLVFLSFMYRVFFLFPQCMLFLNNFA